MISLSFPKDFTFADEHTLVRQGARRFAEEHGSLGAARGLLEGTATTDDSLWDKMVALGWTDGDVDPLSVVLIMEELGRALLPSPLMAQRLALVALRESPAGEARDRWLAAAESGDTLATVGLLEHPGSWQPESVHATATVHRDGYLLKGTKTHVLRAREADLLIFPFQHEERRPLFVVTSTDGVIVEPENCVDGAKLPGRVILMNTQVGAERRLADDSLDVLNTLHQHGRVFSAAEMLGAADAALAMTRDYARDREQFGRAIGSFQAVQHRLVDTLTLIERARGLCYAAASTLDQTDKNTDLLSRMAKASAEDALDNAANAAIRLHGGFGFTWECDAHLFLRRSLWARSNFGDRRHHLGYLARALNDAEDHAQ